MRYLSKHPERDLCSNSSNRHFPLARRPDASINETFHAFGVQVYAGLVQTLNVACVALVSFVFPTRGLAPFCIFALVSPFVIYVFHASTFRFDIISPLICISPPPFSVSSRVTCTLLLISVVQFKFSNFYQFLYIFFLSL